MATLLLDADIPAYAIAAQCETTADFGEEFELAVDLSPENIAELVDAEIAKCCEATDCEKVLVCHSDPQTPGYFRRELYPDYKLNRTGARKPELLQAVKNYMAEAYTYAVLPRLEADDVIGIYATHAEVFSSRGRMVMCSADKDLRTVPGLLYNPQKPDLGILEIDELDADRFHMYQTIVGDSTDGYPGCKGVGPASVYAEEILFADRDELWDIVLDAYASKGLKEADAITQARLARILRAPDWNFKTKKVKLWNPLKLSF